MSGQSAPGHSGSPQSSSFTELDVLRSADGLKAIISQRRSTGVITFAIVKEFERDGQTETTSFIPETMVNELAEMVELVKSRIAKLRTGGGVPAPRAAGRR
jgi:hypothetical protein